MPLYVEGAPTLSDEKLAQLSYRLSRKAPGSGDNDQATRLLGPFPTYWISATDLMWGRLQSAKQQGWRGLLLAGDNPMATADFTDSESMNLGNERLASQLATSLKVAGDLDNAPVNIAVRILSIPDAHITSLWLCGAPGGDYFIPIQSLSPTLSEARLCNLTEIVREVRETVTPQSADAKLNIHGVEPGMPGSKSGLPD